MGDFMVNIIGAGLAGCEAAYYLANNGIKVKLYEMRPIKMTPAHKTEKFGELPPELKGKIQQGQQEIAKAHTDGVVMQESRTDGIQKTVGEQE
jgi:folate-dependent tRNA-U54 methylase TrmFO/GidA